MDSDLTISVARQQKRMSGRNQVWRTFTNAFKLSNFEGFVQVVVNMVVLGLAVAIIFTVALAFGLLFAYLVMRTH